MKIVPGDVGDDKLIGDLVLGVSDEAVVDQVMISPPGDTGAGSAPQNLDTIMR